MSLIRLTNLCNEKCLFCNFPDDCQNLSLAEAKAEIDKQIKDNEKIVTLTGGEPTIYPDLKEVIVYAKNQGLKQIELQSNCLRLADFGLASELKNIGLTGVFVTIHSHDKKTFEEITQIQDSFEKTFAGVKNLYNLGLQIRFNIVINSLNYKDLLKITQFIQQQFPTIECLDFSFIVPCDNVLQKPNLLPRISEVVPYLLQAYKYCQENKIKFSNPGCGLPLCFISQYKEISLEYQILKNQSKSETINDNRTEKIKFVRCKNCEFDKYCLGFWPNYIKIHGEKEFI